MSRRTALTSIVLAAGLVALGLLTLSGDRRHPVKPRVTPTTTPRVRRPVRRPVRQPVRQPARRDYAVAAVTLRLVDPSRTIRSSGGPVPRAFETIVRYPVARSLGQPSGRFPMIVFGHGFAVTPAPYSRLLDAWTRAGYVVAAPVFPLENADAPGGPNEQDLVNQPGDMSLVISSLTTASERGSGPLAGMIDSGQIAVAGQSDGGDTALAAAYDPTIRDPRIRAAVILSGAEDPFAAQFQMPHTGPALLAVQGTADTINPPDSTYSFYREAGTQKFLLKLPGAGHQPPYTEPGPLLDAVERTTTAFLDYICKGKPKRLRSLLAAGGAGAGSLLSAG